MASLSSLPFSPSLSNFENSLSVYASEVQKNNGRFVGIGIFAEWTMDENEWEVYERFKNPFLLGKLWKLN